MTSSMTQRTFALINQGFQMILVAFVNKEFTCAVVALAVLFALFKIRCIFQPMIKLILVYSAVFVAYLTIIYGMHDVVSLESMKDVNRSFEASKWAFAVCFATGLVTPKKARQALKQPHMYGVPPRRVFDHKFRVPSLSMARGTDTARMNL